MSNGPDVSQCASMWTMPTGRSLPTARRIGSVIEWSPPTESGATPASTIAVIVPLDVLVRHLEVEAAAERHVADVGDPQLKRRRAVEHVIVGADALDACGARAARSARRCGW